MSGKCKLSPEAQAAVIAWHSEYLRIKNRLHKLGSYAERAKEHGISERRLHSFLSRPRTVRKADASP